VAEVGSGPPPGSGSLSAAEPAEPAGLVLIKRRGALDWAWPSGVSSIMGAINLVTTICAMRTRENTPVPDADLSRTALSAQNHSNVDRPAPSPVSALMCCLTLVVGPSFTGRRAADVGCSIKHFFGFYFPPRRLCDHPAGVRGVLRAVSVLCPQASFGRYALWRWASLRDCALRLGGLGCTNMFPAGASGCRRSVSLVTTMTCIATCPTGIKGFRLARHTSCGRQVNGEYAMAVFASAAVQTYVFAGTRHRHHAATVPVDIHVNNTYFVGWGTFTT